MLRVNSDIFDLDSDCKVLKFWPTKNNDKVHQAIVQTDKRAYEKLMAAGGIFVGYDYCSIYDAVEVNRCYKCNEYGHSSRVCKNNLCCPLCGDNHVVKDCTSVVRKCSNCSKLGRPKVDHAVWDHSCPVFNDAISKLRNDILAA